MLDQPSGTHTKDPQRELELTSASRVAPRGSLALGGNGDSHPPGIVDGRFGLGDGGHSLLASSEDGLFVPVV